jgi:PAS domain S-box-containing protein
LPLTSSSPTVVYVSDPEAAPRLSYLSENVEHLLGYAARQFLEDPQFWVALLHPQDRDEAVARRAGRAVECVPQLEYRLRHPDGAYRWIRDSLKPVTDSEASPISASAFGSTSQATASPLQRQSPVRFRFRSACSTAPPEKFPHSCTISATRSPRFSSSTI